MRGGAVNSGTCTRSCLASKVAERYLQATLRGIDNATRRETNDVVAGAKPGDVVPAGVSIGPAHRCAGQTAWNRPRLAVRVDSADFAPKGTVTHMYGEICLTRTRSPSTLRLLAPMILALTAVGCGKSDQTATPVTAVATSPAAWSTHREQFLEAYFKAHPAFAVTSGRHEYDGRLPDWSAAGIAAEIKRLHAARDGTAAFADAALSEAERFERDYLVARVDRDLFWLEIAEAPFKNPAFYVDWISDGLDPAPYLTREYAPLDQRMRAYIAYLRAVPIAAQQIRTNLRAPLALPLLERGASAFNGFADFYEHEAPATFASVTDASLQSDLKEASRVAASAMHELGSWLEGQRSAATGSFALGAEKFATMIRMTEQVTTPLAELEAVGRADLDRNLAALRDACAKYAPGKSVAVCFRKMNEDKPTGGAVEGARQQLAGLKQFLLDKQVVTIPGDEQARVAEAPPYNRANSAYIDIPGPYEKGLPATYYIAPPDPHLVRAGTSRLHSRACRSPVHFRARSLARTFPAVPAFEPLRFDGRARVCRLCVRGGLGTLRRRNDVGDGLRQRRS